MLGPYPVQKNVKLLIKERKTESCTTNFCHDKSRIHLKFMSLDDAGKLEQLRLD